MNNFENKTISVSSVEYLARKTNYNMRIYIFQAMQGQAREAGPGRLKSTMQALLKSNSEP